MELNRYELKRAQAASRESACTRYQMVWRDQALQFSFTVTSWTFLILRSSRWHASGGYRRRQSELKPSHDKFAQLHRLADEHQASGITKIPFQRKVSSVAVTTKYLQRFGGYFLGGFTGENASHEATGYIGLTIRRTAGLVYQQP